MPDRLLFKEIKCSQHVGPYFLGKDDLSNGFANGQTDYYRKRSIDVIINGSEGSGFRGLAQYIQDFLATLSLDNQTHEQVTDYVKFIQERASGKDLK
jgi:hypothetical protein